MNATDKEILKAIRAVRQATKKQDKKNKKKELRELVREKTTINLSLCGIDDKDVKILAQALKGNKGIIEIDLSFNKIGDKAVKVLAGIKTLTSLNLRGNKITKKGVKYFFSNISNFQELDLISNKNIKVGDIKKYAEKEVFVTANIIIDESDRVSSDATLKNIIAENQKIVKKLETLAREYLYGKIKEDYYFEDAKGVLIKECYKVLLKGLSRKDKVNFASEANISKKIDKRIECKLKFCQQRDLVDLLNWNNVNAKCNYGYVNEERRDLSLIGSNDQEQTTDSEVITSKSDVAKSDVIDEILKGDRSKRKAENSFCSGNTNRFYGMKGL